MISVKLGGNMEQGEKLQMTTKYLFFKYCDLDKAVEDGGNENCKGDVLPLSPIGLP